MQKYLFFVNNYELEENALVEKIVFIFILIVAVGGGVLGCIYEFGGKKVRLQKRRSPLLRRGKRHERRNVDFDYNRRSGRLSLYHVHIGFVICGYLSKAVS